jgi:hypothetical protein
LFLCFLLSLCLCIFLSYLYFFVFLLFSCSLFFLLSLSYFYLFFLFLPLISSFVPFYFTSLSYYLLFFLFILFTWFSFLFLAFNIFLFHLYSFFRFPSFPASFLPSFHSFFAFLNSPKCYSNSLCAHYEADMHRLPFLRYSHVSINAHIIRAATTKFPEWFYCKHTCIPTAYWEGLPSKYSPWAAIHITQRRCHCLKHFWNSFCGRASTIVTFFVCLQCPEIFITLRQSLFRKQP